MVQTAKKWKPIEDLPENWVELASTELESLAKIWNSQANNPQSNDAIKKFSEQRCREWAIETGIIENIYYIDSSTTQLMIERGFEIALIPHGSTNKPPEKIIPILKDQQEALEGLFSFVVQERQLSLFYIRELHQVLTRHQETVDAVNAFGDRVQVTMLSGQWKQNPNNPTIADGTIHEYCPPVQVQPEMERLLSMHLEHTKLGVPPEVEAAWLHHRFTQIHPFQDGNGRVARALASLVFIKAGGFPLVITRKMKDEYIDALSHADNGNLSYLINLFALIQKKSLIKALSLSSNLLNDKQQIKQAIATGIKRLKSRQEKPIQQMHLQAFALAHQLSEIAESDLVSIALLLDSELKEIEASYSCDVKRSDSNNNYLFRQQIVKTALALEYFADTRTYCEWRSLRIRSQSQTEIIISFHGLGFEFFGIMAASAFILNRDIIEDNAIASSVTDVLSREVFQFSYIEPENAVIERFKLWLENVLIVGLEKWSQQV